MAPKRAKQHTAASKAALAPSAAAPNKHQSSAAAGGSAAQHKTDHKSKGKLSTASASAPAASTSASASAASGGSGSGGGDSDAVAAALAASLADSAYTHLPAAARYTEGQSLHPHAPHVFIGAKGAALNAEWLRRAGVRWVLDVGSGNAKPVGSGGGGGAGVSGVQVLRFDSKELPDAETTDLRGIFDRCHEFIDQARPKPSSAASTNGPAAAASGGAVLVHCYQGISRSATIVISYLMRSCGLPLRDALAAVVAARPVVRPNDAFLKQLAAYEAEISASK
jgi:hypothetical protein